jgi:tetratricopeptide (TPR) repeat protein
MNWQNLEAMAELTAAHTDRARVLGPYHAATFATRDSLGAAYLTARDPQAIPFLEQLRNDARKHLGADDVRTLKAQFNFGVALTYAGRLEEGIREMEFVQASAKRLNFRTDHPYLISACYEGGAAYKKAGNFVKAIELLEMALKLYGEFERETPFTWAIRHDLGWCYLSAARRDDAIAVFEKNLQAAQPPRDAVSMEALGWALRTVDSDRTIGLYEKARQLRSDRSGADDPEALRVGAKQASLMRDFSKASEALARWDEILPRLEKVHGREHLTVLKAQVEKARCLALLKQLEPADEVFRETIARLETSQGPNHIETLEGRYWWMLAARDCGQYERVIEMADDLVSRWKAAGTKPTRVADVLFQKGSNLNRMKRHAEGEPPLREALAIYLQETPEAWTTANCKYHLGASLANQQKFAVAEEMLLTAFDEMTQRIAVTPTWGGKHRGLVAESLVKLYSQHSKHDEAKKWQQQLDALTMPKE